MKIKNVQKDFGGVVQLVYAVHFHSVSSVYKYT